jgi:hypothetical protein
MKVQIHLLVFAVLLTARSEAAIIVRAEAGGPGISAVSADYGNAQHLYAVAYSGGNTSAGIGSLIGCQPNCANSPHGAGKAEADGSKGRLRAGGGAALNGGFSGSGEASMIDTITFLSPNPQITITIDGEIAASNDGGAAAGMSFIIFFPDSDGGGDAVDEPFFELVAVEQNSTRYHYVSYTFDSSLNESSIGIPSRFQYVLDLPFIFTLMPQTIGFALGAGGGCETESCYAYANYENTLYIGIPGGYVSENGYSYLGAPADTGAPVPEPATCVLTTAGVALALLALLRRRA